MEGLGGSISVEMYSRGTSVRLEGWLKGIGGRRDHLYPFDLLDEGENDSGSYAMKFGDWNLRIHMVLT